MVVMDKKVEEIMLKKDETAVAVTEGLKKSSVLRSLSRKHLMLSLLSSIMLSKSTRKWKRLRWKIGRMKSWRRLGQSDVLDG